MGDENAAGDGDAKFNSVFVISLIFVAGIGGWGLVDPDGMTCAFLGFTDYMLKGIS